MNSKLLKKLEEIKKEYETSEVCMGEMLDSVSADGFSIEEAHWLYMRAMEWANGDKFYIHIGEDEDVLSKDELEEANLRVCHKSMAHPLLCYLLHNPRSIVVYSKKGII